MHSGFGSLLQIRNDEPQRLPLDPGWLRGLDRERPPGRRGRGCKQLQRRVRQRAGEHDDDRDENHEERARPPTLLRFNERLRFWRGRTGWLHPSPPKLKRSRSLKRRSVGGDRKSTRLNSSHLVISYAVFCLKKK